ncbi:hypothetical protein GGH94_004441 [Coemansia aciculifera]|uniref:Uncharacterized protein n=1 Tax=Coemansia aciculifera TaxID=417176 RepID=A0A9W8M3L2_9FUNG|nr:hypothetical protein GGH94_004441 [Coemansia aciculifera]
MSADQPLPVAEEDVVAEGAGPAWQKSHALAQAIEDAMASLGQQRVDGFANADILSGDDDEEAGADDMTREIMGAEYTENLTLSRVDFDQWMSNHAELDEEEQEEYADFDEQVGPPVDVRDKWQADRVAWDLQNRVRPEQAVSGGFGTEDDPITIGSSDVDEYDEEEYGEDEYYDEDEESEVYGEDDGYDMDEYQQQTPAGLHLNVSNDSESLVGAAQSVSGVECEYLQPAGPVTPGVDQAASVANTMLILNGSLDSSANESITGPISPPLTAYQRPPLPPTHSLPPSLIEMHKTISQSIDRSLSIVDEISTSCEAAASAWTNESSTDVVTPADSAHGQSDEEEIVRAFELETHDSIELAGQAIDRLRELQAESTKKQTALNTQIFKLSGELFQTTSEKTLLESSVKRLERDNGEYAQTIDDLQLKMRALRAASSEEIEGLKERVRHVAGKITVVSGELAEVNGRLDETRQVLAMVDGERTNLIGKCRGLETTVESLLLRLDGEHKQHEQTRRALFVASDGNANEARRAELEAANRGLEQRCKDLVDEVGQSKNRERLLLNSNRALEARLGDMLRKLDSPPTVLAEHRRNWDMQLIESRREAADIRKRLETVKSDLADERRGAEALKKRVRELEHQRGDQSVKKRRLEEVVTPIRDGQRSYSYEPVTPSRLADKSAMRNTLAGAEYSGLQQTLVDAGEHARDRRRKNDLGTPTWATDQRSIRRVSNVAGGPVTPRIGLTPQTPARRGVPGTPTAKPYR